uniref:Uncharacterized protein n=1 Tax=Leersia perrieri TaxID=77586 RepID=A0A0D9WDH2_9ORYZ
MERRRRLLRHAWELSAALSCGFAYQVERITSVAMAVVVGGFHVLILNDDGHGSEDCHHFVVDDGEASVDIVA